MQIKIGNYSSYFFNSLLFILMTSLVLTCLIFAVTPEISDAQIAPIGSGGRLVAGEFDVFNFVPNCGLTITIAGPEATPLNWGEFQWDVATPSDSWFESMALAAAGDLYPHAEVCTVAAVIPSVNPLCPLPMVVSIGTSLSPVCY